MDILQHAADRESGNTTTASNKQASQPTTAMQPQMMQPQMMQPQMMQPQMMQPMMNPQLMNPGFDWRNVFQPQFDPSGGGSAGLPNPLMMGYLAGLANANMAA